MTTSSIVRRVLVVGLIGGGVVACGLKGPLELPERSTNIVIRGPGQAPTPETGTETGEPSATPPTPASPAPATKPAQPRDERLPPPQLPDGNPGSSRGG
jgi:predicted small lipoprotein YifL